MFTIVLLALPIVTWAFVHPVRIFAPEIAGVKCLTEFVCVDNAAKIDEALALYEDAIEFVNTRVGRIDSQPRAIFCFTKACSRSFGLYDGAYASAGAYNVGTFGLVISYRGWHPYFIRHELIHHLQNEQLGSLNTWFFKPDWFKEGMAYSLSDDPRKPLPKILEGYRADYEAWATKVARTDLWKEAGKL